MRFKQTMLASSVALALLATGSQAWAQDAGSVAAAEDAAGDEAAVMEEVVVKGIRSSLTEAADYKRLQRYCGCNCCRRYGGNSPMAT